MLQTLVVQFTRQGNVEPFQIKLGCRVVLGWFLVFSRGWRRGDVFHDPIKHGRELVRRRLDDGVVAAV